MPSPEAVLVLRPQARWRKVADEAVVVIQDAGQVAGLNATGAAVLEAVDGRSTVSQIVERLAPRWDVPRERLTEDVGRILDQLLELRVLEVAEGAR